jgi:glycosyl transferase family 25
VTGAAAPRPPGVGAALEALGAWADTAYVVTLRRAAERHAHCRATFADLDFEFHYGADKADLDLAAMEARGDLVPWRKVRRLTGKRRPLRPGEVGCALSHRQVYEDVVRRGIDRAVVLEDDVAPRAADVAALGEALAELPDDWDLVYLGYTHFERVTRWQWVKRLTYLGLAPLGVLPWRLGEVVRLHPRPYSAHLRRAGYHDGTYAYAVSRSGAEKLLRAQTPLAHAADHLFVNLILGGELNAFVVEPKMFDEVSARIGGGPYAGESVAP